MSQTKCPFLRQLLQYLLVKLAPVILRVKPAGMLRLTNCRQLAGGRQYDLFCVHQREVMESLKLECRILRSEAGESVVLFFDRARLARALAEPEAAEFLQSCGYPATQELEPLLEELIARCRSGREFPHEIGIFLGYPLKDVRGFIENSAACLAVPRGLWRVAGDPAESLRVMEQYRCAEQTIQSVLERSVSFDRALSRIHRVIAAA
ncbi:DUF3793 family protein [Victivallis vadensis]|uniref:DUF3793 family protein n=1 Tax=Victivallis vadensis TaxID=172901 RepID=UPI0026725D0A|nr:DUF3793 family protein [Victivallis vadensis]